MYHRTHNRRVEGRCHKVALSGVLIFTVACQQQSGSPPAQEVTIVAHDYAFQFPESLAAGPTTFRFRNDGKVDHEMFMVPLKPGVTWADAMQRAKAGENTDSLYDHMIGVLIAKAGVTTPGALSVDLLPNRTYAFFCWFKDGPDKKQHSDLGMISSRTIGSTE